MTSPTLNTPARIITLAMFDSGRLEEGQVPNSEQMAVNMGRLNDLINTWMLSGLKLWLLADTSVTLTASKQKYTFKPSGDVNMTRPIRVLDGYILNTSNISRPIYSLSWDQWIRLSNRSTTGTITQYFVDKQATELDVYFWLIPDATEAANTAHVLLQNQVSNFTGCTDTMNFPIEWTMALRWGLADDLASGQPAVIMQRCAQKAGYYKTLLDDWDVEDAPVRFVADTQQQMWGFR